jgi:phage shock protein C
MTSRFKSDIKAKQHTGWGINLYRDKDKGYIGGVCAGLAQHFDVDSWVVRLVTFGGFLFLGSFVLVGYAALWWLLAPRPQAESYEYEYDEQQQGYRPKKMFKYADSAKVRLQRVRERLHQVSDRVVVLERHITSKQFDLEREFSKLKDKP